MTTRTRTTKKGGGPAPSHPSEPVEVLLPEHSPSAETFGVMAALERHAWGIVVGFAIGTFWLAVVLMGLAAVTR